MQDAFVSTVRTTGMIFLIILAAFTLSFAFARLGISQQIAEAISSLNLNEIQLVLVLVVFYLVLGTFMESFAMMVTTVPILLPTLEGAGVDLVWFGVIMVLLVEAALISPPEGINLYVLHGVRLDVDREQAEAGKRGVAAKHHRGCMDRCDAFHGLHGSNDGPGTVLPGDRSLVAECHLRGKNLTIAAFTGTKEQGRVFNTRPCLF